MLTPQQDHVTLMRRFRLIIQDAESPGAHADRFPDPPRALPAEDEAARWRVQALLMNAEVRYALYLRLLEEWVVANKEAAENPDNWPLPPW